MILHGEAYPISKDARPRERIFSVTSHPIPTQPQIKRIPKTQI